MPVSVRHIPVKSGRDWAIVEKSTGHVKGRSETKANAEASARVRNVAIHTKKR
jgi:hypothetical protein